MNYKRYFEYEVFWSGVYYRFKYLQDARRFLRKKRGYTIVKNLYDKNMRYIGYKWIETGT